MTDIERALRPRSVFDEKKSETAKGYPNGGSDESPTRIEEGGKGGLLMNEEDAIARLKAYPDDSTPIYLTWELNDHTNPRNWPVWCTKLCQRRCGLTFGIAGVEEMVDYLLRQLPELPDVSCVQHVCYGESH